MSDHPSPPLSPLEARVLGVLVEKEHTTPDIYPLTLNALVSGCNQKTSRHPVMTATEDEIRAALDSLKRGTLVIDSYGASGRVMRYAHNMPKGMALNQAQTALLAVLMLRGPQTSGELRTNCDRIYGFADLSSVEAYLEELAARPQSALVIRLPRQPGSREHRWAQLLCGPVETGAESSLPAAVGASSITTGELAALKANLDSLREEVTELRALVERLLDERGTPK